MMSDAIKIRCIVEGEIGHLHGPFPLDFLRVISTLSGHKKWAGARQVKFEAISNNIRRLKECDHNIEFEDRTGDIAAIEELEKLATQHSYVPAPRVPYQPKWELRDYQQRCLAQMFGRASFAILMEMGLGKTAVEIAEIGMLTKQQRLTGVLVIAPNGVHKQWLEEQVPEHMDASINWTPILWKGKKIDPERRSNTDVTIFAMNIEAISTRNGRTSAALFLREHKDKSMVVIDESHLIKTPDANCTKAAWLLRDLTPFRRTLTGTPIAKNLADMWSPFKFMDERIIGHKYVTSFRSEFCIMGGHDNRQIVAQKNTEEFYRRIAPHSFRMTKAEALDLPEKIYVQRPYAMGPKTRKHYDELKRTFMTALSDGAIVDVPNGVTCLLRLQQVICGYLPRPDTDDEMLYEEISSERIDQMMEILRQTNGKTIVWARFRRDIERIVAALEGEFGRGCTAQYHGGNVKTRDVDKERFLNDNETRFFISNPQSGGVGLNLQSSGCQTVIFYSNDYNYITRMQAEDRVHRLGMKGAVTYFDIIAERSVDGAILKNLKSKKSMADLTLDEIRMAVAA